MFATHHIKNNPPPSITGKTCRESVKLRIEFKWNSVALFRVKKIVLALLHADQGTIWALIITGIKDSMVSCYTSRCLILVIFKNWYALLRHGGVIWAYMEAWQRSF